MNDTSDRSGYANQISRCRESHDMDILETGFDRYTRYSLIARLVEQVRIKKPMRILDVGGGSGLLGSFLCEDTVVVMDIRPPQSNTLSNCILGNITYAPFKSQSFDLVISSDVYEHVPSQEREEFITEMLRLSHNFVILGAPFYSREVDEAETAANNFWLKMTGEPHQSLREHLENKLPKEEELELRLKKHGYEFHMFGINNLHTWLILMLFYYYTEHYQVPQDKVGQVWRFYNDNFVELGDFQEPTYRKIYLIGKRGTLPRVSLYDEVEIDSSRHQKLISLIFDTIYEDSVQKVSRISMQEALQAKDSQIVELESQMEQIHHSIVVQLMSRYQRVVEKLLPPGTRRQYYYELVLTGFRVIMNEGLRSFCYKTREWLSRSSAGKARAFFPNLYHLTPANQTMTTPGAIVPQDLKSNLVDVDIVTVTYNSGRFIKDFVDSVQALDYPLELLSLTVIDGCSSDDTLEILDSIVPDHPFKQFQVIREKYNPGYGKGINRAAKTGSAPYIFVVNPDVKLTENCLSILLEKALNDNEAWLWEPRQFPYEHPKYYDPLSLETLWSSGAAFLVRRDRFDEVGGFDESLFMYVDDVDLSFKIWNSGGKCRYVPHATLWHFAYSKPSEVKPLQWYYSIRNNLLIRYKFGRVFEIIKGYLLLTGLFLKGNADIRRARLRIISLFFSHLKLVPSMISWRLRNRKPLFNRYSFLGWDYEVRRLGDFYELSPCPEQPLVTIVCRTMSRPSYLRNTLKSIVNQTYRPLEVVIIEDGPATCQAVVDEFMSVPRLSLKYQPLGVSRGRCQAGNEGLRLATGIFINFLDDDDLLYPDHVEVLVQALLGNNLLYKAAQAASFLVQATYTEETTIPREFVSYFNKYSKDELKIRTLFPIQAVLFHRDLYDALGGLDESLSMLEDWDLWLRYTKATDFLSVEKTTSEYRIPEDRTIRSTRQARLDRPYWYVRNRHMML